MSVNLLNTAVIFKTEHLNLSLFSADKEDIICSLEEGCGPFIILEHLVNLSRALLQFNQT